MLSKVGTMIGFHKKLYSEVDVCGTSSKIAETLKLEIEQFIEQCITLSDNLLTIFYLYPELSFSSGRYSYNNPHKTLDFVIITDDKESADSFYTQWVIHEAKSYPVSGYNYNLVIVSEDEFTREFYSLDTLKERILNGLIVYDEACIVAF